MAEEDEQHRAGRWKKGRTGQQESIEERRRGNEARKRTEERKRDGGRRSSTKVSRPCPATRANYPTSHFLPGCVPCFFDLG